MSYLELSFTVLYWKKLNYIHRNNSWQHKSDHNFYHVNKLDLQDENEIHLKFSLPQGTKMDLPHARLPYKR